MHLDLLSILLSMAVSNEGDDNETKWLTLIRSRMLSVSCSIMPISLRTIYTILNVKMASFIWQPTNLALVVHQSYTHQNVVCVHVKDLLIKLFVLVRRKVSCFSLDTSVETSWQRRLLPTC